MQRPIIYDLYYARGKYMQKPIICKGKIYAKTYNMQGQNICKDL